MAGVEFEEAQMPSSYTPEAQNSPGLARFMIHNGIVRTEQQAMYVLLVCIVVVTLIAIFIFTNKPKGAQPFTKQQIEQIKADQEALLHPK